ncbi:hypothetical protein [Flammeovirga aprica]|uniref:Uncharacterized protein n=1 Tax=Flammeovirga aprica JL-4 TaxID=694437 RepID=A0A7X9P0C3_9BACT|nr:hypothetical protein [Flammeovirga aprica]NME67193.1 hypothetical protein [Flammeovirga aprica JL-4]
MESSQLNIGGIRKINLAEWSENISYTVNSFGVIDSISNATFLGFDSVIDSSSVKVEKNSGKDGKIYSVDSMTKIAKVTEESLSFLEGLNRVVANFQDENGQIWVAGLDYPLRLSSTTDFGKNATSLNHVLLKIKGKTLLGIKKSLLFA